MFPEHSQTQRVPETSCQGECRARLRDDKKTISYGKSKTSDFLRVKFRCFASKVRRFDAKKSDVFAFPKRTPPEKVLCFSPTFLHQSLKFPLFIGDFGWRIGCRIQLGCRIHPAFSVLFILFFPLWGTSISCISLWFRVRYSIKLSDCLAFSGWLVGKAFKVDSMAQVSSIVDK